MAVIKVNLPAFFGMLTDRQMLPESHGKQNETKNYKMIVSWSQQFSLKHKPRSTARAGHREHNSFGVKKRYYYSTLFIKNYNKKKS